MFQAISHYMAIFDGLSGWDLFWACVGIGVIGGGLLVALGVLGDIWIDLVEGKGDRG